MEPSPLEERPSPLPSLLSTPSPPSTPTPPLLTPTLASPALPLEPDSPRKSRRIRLLDAVERESFEDVRAIAAEPGGFLNPELRRIAWPFLLGVDSPGVEKGSLEVVDDHEDGVVIPGPHNDEGQVRLDVNRSFVSFPRGISSEDKDALQVKLEDIIVTILRKHPSLNYFQGCHDIITVFLLNLDNPELSLAVSEQMSLHRIRDYCGTGLEPVLGYLRLVHRILERVDPDLAELVGLAAPLPFFSLSWVLTLLSHDLDSLSLISRLFDFLLVHNPAMISYLSVAIILLKKEELALLEDDDPSMLHHTLSQLPPFAEPLTEASLYPEPHELDDEDLMAPSHRASSLAPSFLSDSVTTTSERSSSPSPSASSLDEPSSASYYRDAADNDSLFLSDSMLSDMDITGPAFDPLPPLLLRPASPPPRPPAPTVSLDDLIARALELYSQFPLVGEGGIGADRVLGPKSCVFTWELSREGRLSDGDADEIAARGVDIVLPPEEEEVQEVERASEANEKETKPSGKKSRRRRRRKVEVGVGAALTLVGLAGMLLAIYGGDVRAGSFKEWGKEWGKKGLVALPLRLNWSYAAL